MNKKIVAANDLLEDSFQLAANIAEAGFHPDFLVGLWRGGSAVGIAVQEGLDFLGIKTDHIAIRTSYRGAPAHHSLLIVDDVYSTGSSVNAVIEQLARKTRRNLPQDIRIATVWYRPGEKTLRVPDYFVHETSDWLALPYELAGMSIAELRENRPDLDSIIDRLEPLVG